MKTQSSNIIKYLLYGTLLMILIMQYTGHPLKTPTTHGGILSLEFADTKTKIQSIYDAWQATNIRNRTNISQARINTYWDFVFIFFYSALFFYWNWVSAQNPVNNKYLGKAAALLAIIAGTLDVIENLGMLKSLNGNISDATADMTSLCATIKFSLLGISVLILMVQRFRIWRSRSGLA